MLRDYDDITSRLGEPEWYDDQGVPRYKPFHPKACGVYDRVVAFLSIRCQSCQRPFSVAVCRDMMNFRDIYNPDATYTLPTHDDHGSFHYGDPPRHDCVGDTMNCDHGRVLELWEQADPFKGWKRIDDQMGQERRVWPAEKEQPR
jgi:hypothetical protein